jgi:hypothetical protein
MFKIFFIVGALAFASFGLNKCTVNVPHHETPAAPMEMMK